MANTLRYPDSTTSSHVVSAIVQVGPSFLTRNLRVFVDITGVRSIASGFGLSTAGTALSFGSVDSATTSKAITLLVWS